MPKRGGPTFEASSELREELTALIDKRECGMAGFARRWDANAGTLRSLCNGDPVRRRIVRELLDQFDRKRKREQKQNKLPLNVEIQRVEIAIFQKLEAEFNSTQCPKSDSSANCKVETSNRRPTNANIDQAQQNAVTGKPTARMRQDVVPQRPPENVTATGHRCMSQALVKSAELIVQTDTGDGARPDGKAVRQTAATKVDVTSRPVRTKSVGKISRIWRLLGLMTFVPLLICTGIGLIASLANGRIAFCSGTPESWGEGPDAFMLRTDQILALMAVFATWAPFVPRKFFYQWLMAVLFYTNFAIWTGPLFGIGFQKALLFLDKDLGNWANAISTFCHTFGMVAIACVIANPPITRYSLFVLARVSARQNSRGRGNQHHRLACA